MTLVKAALLLLLLVAALTDLCQRRIPNILLAFGALIGLGASLSGFGMVPASQALLGAGIGFLFFLLPYVFGRMGAGDVKFLTVIGLFVGPVAVMKVALYAMLAGGVLALLLLCLRTGRFIEGKNIPYAVGISIGALLVLAEMN